MSVYGFIHESPLLTWFPVLGIVTGLSHLLYWWRQPRFRKSWIVEHLSGMLSSGIGTVTAFVVFGAPRMFALDGVPIWLWFIPAILISPLIFFIFLIRRNTNGRKEEKLIKPRWCNNGCSFF